MPIEDDYTRLVNSVMTVDVTRNGLGARGIDQIEKTTSTGTVVAYPLYDGHGNMVGTLSRSGLGFAVNDRRTYDAWGLVRTGAQTGDPKGRYVANLGHVQDDESGLVYMRARYYEPSTGRFVSEDPARHGYNWFVYCNSNPTRFVDQSGKSPNLLGAYLFVDLLSVLGLAVTVLGYGESAALIGFTGATIGWAGGVAFFLVLGIWGAANTFASLIEIASNLSYRAGLVGRGEEVLAVLDKLKGSRMFASLAHHLEIVVWLGIVDSE